MATSRRGTEEPVTAPVSTVRNNAWTRLIHPLLSFIVLLELDSFSARCLDFELSGTSTHETFYVNGSRAATFSSRFTVQKTGDKWLVINSPVGSLTTESVMFDGSDVYTLTRNIRVPKRDINKLPRDAVIYNEGVAYAKAPTAIIFSGEIPLGAGTVSRLLWEAYLAERTLKSPGAAAPPAPWDAAYGPEASSFRLHVQWPDSDAHFPASITFISSRALWDNSANQLGLTNSSPYEDGFTAGSYRVSEWTNVDGETPNVRVPVVIELERYFPARYKPASSVAERVVCRATNVVVAARPILPLELDTDVNVLDYRFRDEALPWLYVVYAITNKTWMSTNDAQVRALIGPSKTRYIRAKSMKPYVPSATAPGSPLRLRYVRFLLVLGCICPIAVLLVWKLTHSRVKKITATN